MKRRGRPPYPDVLTPRQREVLELLREQRTNAEIARELGISHDGAKWHVSEIITRLGVTSRHEAADSDGTRPAAPSPTASVASGISRFRPRAVRPTLHRNRSRARCGVRSGRIAA